ncbi:unnamed protein product [Ilex paraguariensis]|uniref:Uncharacterized protein n=1 Tax=Ilex paraguariensis TaxID=185542 RepID=A0ABC8SFJ2_9AQUA
MSRQLSNTINNELASLSSTPFEPYIFRVDGPLCRKNEKVYEPEILTIDPYQHEVLFRNMIVYEQYNGSTKAAYVTHYLTFLDCLVNTPKDAEILHHHGIIDNWLGDDEAFSTMLNKLCNNIILDGTTFCYSEVFNKVNDYCKCCRPRWMAKLRHYYFNSTWSIISLFGVTLLLLLTIIQTICSILQVS